MRQTLLILMIPATLAFAGCCCLRIPSVRYQSAEIGCDTLPGSCSSWSTGSEGSMEGCADTCSHEPHLLEPFGKLVPPVIANWHPFQAWAERSNQPEWPRFHPIPHRPALAPPDVCDPEQTLVYGRFGEVQATYMAPPSPAPGEVSRSEVNTPTATTPRLANPRLPNSKRR